MLNPAHRRLASAWVPVAIWMGVIFLASTDLGAANQTSRVIEPLVHWIKPDATADQVDLVHFLVRKTAHLTEYAALGLLLLRALRLSFPRFQQNLRAAAATALALAACYAATDELHQSFVADRTACLQDVAIDTAGACTSIAAATAVLVFRRKRSFAAAGPASAAAFESVRR